MKSKNNSDRKFTQKDEKSPDPVNCHGMVVPTKFAFPTNSGCNHKFIFEFEKLFQLALRQNCLLFNWATVWVWSERENGRRTTSERFWKKVWLKNYKMVFSNSFQFGELAEQSQSSRSEGSPRPWLVGSCWETNSVLVGHFHHNRGVGHFFTLFSNLNITNPIYCNCHIDSVYNEYQEIIRSHW